MNRQEKSVFVIMPFNETPTRDAKALTEFFNHNLKERIESNKIAGTQFLVRRSDDTFDINTQIVRDLYNADIVICDLSGREANPNVMYELGVRLSFSNKPVILIREEYCENKKIFDIGGFYTKMYSPLRYREVEEYIIKKIEKYESRSEVYTSPILTVLEKEPSIAKELELRSASTTLVNSGIAISGLRSNLTAT